MSGECEECSKKQRLGLQTKLKVNEPGDIYEQEADRIADQVMATPAHPGVSSAPPRIQRFSGPSNGQMDAAPASVDKALASPGRPLEPTLRQDMEQRFGHDFSRVRVHTGAADGQSAREVNAHAYTVGHDLVFGAGLFAPGTHDGRGLLAHELTHVVQQRSAVQMIQRGPGKGQKDPPAPAPLLPTKVIPGSTHLSRRAQAYRIDNPNLPDSTNLLVVEYSTAKSGRQIEVIPNRPGVAHSEPEMDEFLTRVRRQARGEVTVHEIYSERQPCGPSDSDCEGMLRRRYPRAKTTFGYGYQETEAPARDSRAARTKSNIAAAHQRVAQSRQLEWDFEGRTPPPHFQRNEPGPISTRPRRFGRSGSGSRAGRASKFLSRFGRVGGDEGAAVIVNLLMEKFILGPESNTFLLQELERLQPEIDALLKSKQKEMLELQRRGEIAYANITFQLDSAGKKGQASSLAGVFLKKVEVTEWYKEGTDWARKGISPRSHRGALGGHDIGTYDLLRIHEPAPGSSG